MLYVHQKSLFLIVVINSVFIFSAQVTSYNQWATCYSSTVSKNSSAEFSSRHEQLQQLGKIADKVWQEGGNAEYLVKKLNIIFQSVDNCFLVELIDEILQSDQLLEEVTKASYKNVTGFVKIVLASGGKSSWKLRLHGWEQKEKEYPHNHKWDFFSKIMTGYLEQTVYQHTDQVENSIHYTICEPVSMMPLLENGEKACPCKDHYMLEKKQQNDHKNVFLKEQGTYNIGTGETYFMQNHLIHTITPGKHAISFVFTSENVNENSEVFVPVDRMDTDLRKYAPSLTKQELIEELLFLKKILSRLSLSFKYLPELIHPAHCYFNRLNNLMKFENYRTEILAFQPLRYVAQLSDHEKKEYQVSVNQDGQLLIGDALPLSNVDYLFVLIDDLMYASAKNFAHDGSKLICHTSFTDYAPVDAAGLLRFSDDARLVQIEAYSGHYEPSLNHMALAYQYLKSSGMDMQDVAIVNYQDRL